MKKVKGFTLIETLFATMIIAVIAVTAFGFLVYCHRMVLNSELNLTAINLAHETLLGIYQDPNPQVGITTIPNVPLSHDRTGTVTIAVEERDNYRRIMVTVSW